MAKKGSKVSRLAVKEMVEGWEGRKLPKNISMKALIDMVVDEAEMTESGESPVPVMCDECHVRKEGDHGSRGAEAQNG
jgi:hypothetical protein